MWPVEDSLCFCFTLFPGCVLSPLSENLTHFHFSLININTKNTQRKNVHLCIHYICIQVPQCVVIALCDKDDNLNKGLSDISILYDMEIWEVEEFMVHQWSIIVKCKLKTRMHKNMSLNWHFHGRINVMKVSAVRHVGNWIFLWFNQWPGLSNHRGAENGDQVNISVNRNE